MLVPLNKEAAAMLVSQANPHGIEFYSCANFLLFRLNMVADHVKFFSLVIHYWNSFGLQVGRIYIPEGA